MIGYHLTDYYYNKVSCDCCLRPLPQNKKIAWSRSKRVKSGFWCVACALDRHVITDQEIVRFLKNESRPVYNRPKQEPHRY